MGDQLVSPPPEAEAPGTRGVATPIGSAPIVHISPQCPFRDGKSIYRAGKIHVYQRSSVRVGEMESVGIYPRQGDQSNWFLRH